MQKILLKILALCLVFAPPLVMADITLNGFASIVTGIDLEDEAQSPYTDDTVDSLQESKVALQWTADLGQSLSGGDMRFVGQAMARGSASDGYVLNYDWAYFDLNVGDAGKFKMGRLRIPFYKYSDFLDVGYTYHWISPPESMYSLNFSNVDGVSYLQNFEAAGMEQSVNLVYGIYQGILTVGGVPTDSRLEHLVAINWSASIGDHEFYAAYAQANVLIPAPAVEGLAPLAANPEDVSIDKDYGHFVGVGYSGMFNNVGLYAEYSQVGIEDSLLSDTAGGYLGVSYTMDNYTFHITGESAKTDEKTYTGGASGIDIGLASGGAANGTDLNSVVRSLGNGDSNTVTVGVRNEIGDSTALKLDVSSYEEDRIQNALIASTSEKRKSTVVKIAIETMF